MRLVIHNYGILEDLEIELSPGLTTLSGQNGSGKSTTVDALYFALTGEPLDGRNVAELVNWGAMDGRAFVKLSCDDFTVTRTIKSGLSHKLELSDGTVLTKKADINAWIFDHFKIDNPDVICDIFFSAQLHATDLFDTTNSVRLSMLSRMFGFEHLEKLRDVIYRTLSETPMMTVNEELIQQLSDRVAGTTAEITDVEFLLATAQQIVNDLHFDQAKFEEVMKAPLDAERQFHLKRRADLQTELESNRVLRDQLNQKSILANELATDRHLWSLHDTREESEARIKELESGVSLEGLKSAQSQANEAFFTLKAEVDRLQKQSTESCEVCPLTNGKPCIELLRLHDPQLIAEELSQKQAKLDDLQNDLRQLELLISMREKDLRELDELKKKVVAIAELGEPTRPRDEVEKLAEELGDLAAVMDSYKEAENAADRIMAEIDHEDVWLDVHQEGESVSEETKNQWAKAKTDYDAAVATTTQLSWKLEHLKETLKTDSLTLAQLQADKDKALAKARKVEVLKDVRDLLSRDNLQRALMQGVMKRINREIEVCAKIFNFKYRVFIEESGDIVFQEDGIEPKDVRFLSGGQKYTAAIITRIAFARVLKTNFIFMVLDEPSICLDDDSRQLLSELLRALNDRFKQEGKYLVVPTHDELITNQGVNINVQGV